MCGHSDNFEWLLVGKCSMEKVALLQLHQNLKNEWLVFLCSPYDPETRNGDEFLQSNPYHLVKQLKYLKHLKCYHALISAKFESACMSFVGAIDH